MLAEDYELLIIKHISEKSTLMDADHAPYAASFDHAHGDKIIAMDSYWWGKPFHESDRQFHFPVLIFIDRVGIVRISVGRSGSMLHLQVADPRRVARHHAMWIRYLLMAAARRGGAAAYEWAGAAFRWLLSWKANNFNSDLQKQILRAMLHR